MDYESVPGSIAELLERIDRDWKALWLLIGQFDEGQMDVPDASGWSVKDNLAHLAAWERYLVEHVMQGRPAHEVMGTDDVTLASASEADLNALIREGSRNRSLPEVVADLRGAHQTMVSVIAGTTYDTLMQPLADDRPEQTLLLWVIGNTYEHYQEHAAMILALLQQLDA